MKYKIEYNAVGSFRVTHAGNDYIAFSSFYGDEEAGVYSLVKVS